MKTIHSISLALLLNSGLIASDNVPTFIPDLKCSDISLPEDSSSDIPTIKMSGCKNSNGGSSGGGGGGFIPTPTEPEDPIEPEPVDPEPTDPEPTVPEPIPPFEPNEPITDDGHFDEDPTTDGVDIIVIDKDGFERQESVDTKDTHKEVILLGESHDDKKSEFTLEIKDTDSGESKSKVIRIFNPNATSTTTSTGFEISATDEDDKKSSVSKVEMNSNGTSVSSLVVTDKESGEKKKAAVSSFNPEAETELGEDGSITVKTTEVEAKVNADGSAEHKVIIGEKSTTATSKANNTVTAILEDGTVQTKATIITEDEKEITVAVDASTDGSSSHLIKVVNSSGSEVITKAESEIPGTTTTITEDGEVETSVQPTEGSEVKVKALIDGKAIHEVAINGKTTTANINIEGANTVIDSIGTVSTTVIRSQILNSGESADVSTTVETDNNGETVTWFDINGNKERTVSETTPLESGADISVSTNSDGKLQFEITTDVTRDLIIE